MSRWLYQLSYGPSSSGPGTDRKDESDLRQALSESTVASGGRHPGHKRALS